MRQLYAYDANDANEYTRLLVEGGISTGLSNTHTTRLMDSLLCITCSLENNAFSVLHNVRKVILHYLCYIARRFEIHSALELSALLGCRLAALRLREAAPWKLYNVCISVDKMIVLEFAQQNWI